MLLVSSVGNLNCRLHDHFDLNLPRLGKGIFEDVYFSDSVSVYDVSIALGEYDSCALFAVPVPLLCSLHYGC